MVYDPMLSEGERNTTRANDILCHILQHCRHTMQHFQLASAQCQNSVHSAARKNGQIMQHMKVIGQTMMIYVPA
jgi:hypothetical protein